MKSFRDYRIERDADGRPARMIWAGDFVLTAVKIEHCQKCGSTRIHPVSGFLRCFDCWHVATMWEWKPAGSDAERADQNDVLRAPRANALQEHKLSPETPPQEPA